MLGSGAWLVCSESSSVTRIREINKVEMHRDAVCREMSIESGHSIITIILCFRGKRKDKYRAREGAL